MEWISVKDKLPKDGTPCIVLCHYGQIYLAEYEENRQRHNWSVYGHNMGCGYSNVLKDLENATHWIQIPKRPKD